MSHPSRFSPLLVTLISIVLFASALAPNISAFVDDLDVVSNRSAFVDDLDVVYDDRPPDGSVPKRIALHATFFYRERYLPYLRAIIAEAERYPYDTDVFVHSNLRGDPATLRNGSAASRVGVHWVAHRLKGTHTFELCRLHRALMAAQADSYDVFIELEADILFRKESLEYWLEHKGALATRGFNLGFLRAERRLREGETTQDFSAGAEGWVLTDIPGSDVYGELDTVVAVGGRPYLLNSVNPYTGTWVAPHTLAAPVHTCFLLVHTHLRRALWRAPIF